MEHVYALSALQSDGHRNWGKYRTPRQFNVAVNDMAELRKHKAPEYDEDFSIASSLQGGTNHGKHCGLVRT